MYPCSQENGSTAFPKRSSEHAAKQYPLLISFHERSQENGKQVNGWTKTYSATDFYEKHPSIIIAHLGYQPFGGEKTAWSNEPREKALGRQKEELRI